MNKWHVLAFSDLGTWENMMCGFCTSCVDANILARWFSIKYPNRAFDCIEVRK